MEITRRPDPLDWELARRRAELSRLERAIAEGEVALEAYRQALDAFERRYFEAFAPRYRELDELEAQLAEKASAVRPDDASKRRKAEKLRARAAGHDLPAAPQPPRSPKPAPSEELKSTYRALSKLIHPDLGVDAEDRQHREALMVQANAAYAAGQLDLLAFLLSGWDAGHGPVPDGAEAAIDRVMARIDQATRRLEAVEAARREAEAAPIAALMRRDLKAREDGRDLFKKLEREFEEHAAEIRKRLKALDRRLARRGGEGPLDPSGNPAP